MAKLRLGTLIGIIVPQILRILGRLSLWGHFQWADCDLSTAVRRWRFFSLILYSLQLLETFGITSTTKQTNILTLVMVIANQKKKDFAVVQQVSKVRNPHWQKCCCGSQLGLLFTKLKYEVYQLWWFEHSPPFACFKIWVSLIFYTLEPLQTVGIT